MKLNWNFLGEGAEFGYFLELHIDIKMNIKKGQ